MAVAARRGLTYHRSNVLLAKACFDGTLELLTAAWQRLLGYGHQEFSGKTLHQIMEPDRPVAAVVAAIFDERNPAPVELKVRSSDGQCKCLKLHRRFDPYERTVFIVAEETPESGSAPRAEPAGDVVTGDA
ncbi:MAG TPA: PAS domain-containing protein [Burkholderiales bacterium]|nr:PAS domain-containing protein [Burkholderiales bacterium]